MPFASGVALAMLGVAEVEEKLFGPLHENDGAGVPVAADVKLIVDPAQTGLLFTTVVMTGAVLMTTAVVDEAVPHPLVTVSE